MKAKLTTTFIRSLQPRAKPYEVRDTQLARFVLRVQPSGVMTYYLEYQRPQGKQRYRLGGAEALTVRQARDLAETYAARVAMGADIQAVKQQERRDHQLANSRTLGGFIAHHYGPWVKAERKTGTETIERLQSCFRDWFDYPLHEITPLVVEKWRSDELQRGKTSSTVNRDLTALRAVLSKAVDWEFLETHPLTKVKPLKTDKRATVRYLSEEETHRLRQALRRRDSELKAARVRGNAWRQTREYPELPVYEHDAYADHVTPMVLLTLNTGLRRGELFQLQWADIDCASHMLTVHGQHAKSHLTRHIPLNREARDVLQNWRTLTTTQGLVFPGKNGQPFDNVKKAWHNLLQRAAIANFRWHDMRHDFASKLVMAGVPLNTVRELLGHADLTSTLRYAHLAPDHKADAVDRLARG